MPTTLHSALTPAELHAPGVSGFTGAPASYVPTAAGLIVIATDTNLIYRTTGTSAGDVTQLGGLATVLETFTGAPASFTPSAADIFAVKTDVTPNRLYRTTGVSAGDVTLVTPLAPDNQTGSPVGAVTPDYSGQSYTQETSDRIVNWVSNGLTNTDWIAVSGTAVQALAQPAETPAFVGQLWQVVTIQTVSPFVTLTELWIGLDIDGVASTVSWYQLV